MCCRISFLRCRMSATTNQEVVLFRLSAFVVTRIQLFLLPSPESIVMHPIELGKDDVGLDTRACFNAFTVLNAPSSFIVIFFA